MHPKTVLEDAIQGEDCSTEFARLAKDLQFSATAGDLARKLSILDYIAKIPQATLDKTRLQLLRSALMKTDELLAASPTKTLPEQPPESHVSYRALQESLADVAGKLAKRYVSIDEAEFLVRCYGEYSGNRTHRVLSALKRFTGLTPEEINGRACAEPDLGEAIEELGVSSRC